MKHSCIRSIIFTPYLQWTLECPNQYSTINVDIEKQIDSINTNLYRNCPRTTKIARDPRFENSDLLLREYCKALNTYLANYNFTIQYSWQNM